MHPSGFWSSLTLNNYVCKGDLLDEKWDDIYASRNNVVYDCLSMDFKQKD